ncbi:MAG: twin-arginine translocation signal domain-containing protein [Lachnospiraceae bacterium]|nr:twin-arginine translocation signal domain-containing protein [Lachnospiraceae bacterium]
MSRKITRRDFLKGAAAGTASVALFGLSMPALASESTKETLENGYEIDMGNLPKVYFSEHPEWAEIYDAAWEYHKNNIKQSTAAINPNEAYYVDENFNDNIFVWDTMFMMVFDKYGLNEFPTLSSIDNFYYCQMDTDDELDGYICHEIQEADGVNYWDDESEPNESGQVWAGTNPPLFAWAEWEQYQVHGDVGRFSGVINGKTVFERLVSHYNYMERRKTLDNGLYGHTTPRGNGLVNTPNGDNDGEQTYNDLCGQQAMSAWYIAKIAEKMGDEEQAEYFYSEHQRIADLINEKLWSEEAHMYSNLDADGVTPTNISTPTALWMLIGQAATEERVEEILKYHTRNSGKLYRPNGLATLSYDYDTIKVDDEGNETSYYFHPEGGYWQGSVWAPTSYQYVVGLREYGYDQLAFEEAVRHVNMMADVYEAGEEGGYVDGSTIWENYSSEYIRNGYQGYGTAEDGEEDEIKNRSRADFVGWSGNIAVAMVMEDIAGININAPDNIVTWTVHLDEEFGVDNLYMCHDGVENRVSLHAEARVNTLSDFTFTATATQPVTLVVKVAETEETFELAAGTETYTIAGTADESAQAGSVEVTTSLLSEASDKNTKEYYDANALDYVYFQDTENSDIIDGITCQTGKSAGLLFNINTVGLPVENQIGTYVTLTESASMEELGFEGAKAIIKGTSAMGDEGFMFMAPASNSMKTIRLVAGIQNGTAKLKASLSDASDSRKEISLSGDSTETEYVIDIPYCSSSIDSDIMVLWLIDRENSDEDTVLSVKSIALMDGTTL